MPLSRATSGGGGSPHAFVHATTHQGCSTARQAVTPTAQRLGFGLMRLSAAGLLRASTEDASPFGQVRPSLGTSAPSRLCPSAVSSSASGRTRRSRRRSCAGTVRNSGRPLQYRACSGGCWLRRYPRLGFSRKSAVRTQRAFGESLTFRSRKDPKALQVHRAQA